MTEVSSVSTYKTLDEYTEFTQAQLEALSEARRQDLHMLIQDFGVAASSGDRYATYDTLRAAFKNVATPEDFGAVGDGTTDDTTAMQAFLDYVVDNKTAGMLVSQYAITSTLTIGTTATAERFVIDCQRSGDINSSTAKGSIVWAGGNTDVMVQLGEVQRASISLALNNRVNAATGITGLRWSNPDAGGTASNHNVFPYLSIAGCELAIHLGDEANDGWDSNIDDNRFDWVFVYDCAHALLIDSSAQDNNVFGYFHSGGVPSIASRTRNYVIRTLRNGNGFKIENGFLQGDQLVADAVAIDIQAGSFSCDRFSVESSDSDILPIKLVGNIQRDQCIIQNFVVSDGIRDSSDRGAWFQYRSGTTLLNCTFTGNCEVRRPVTAINCGFQTGYTWDTLGSNHSLNETGTWYRDDSSSDITSHNQEIVTSASPALLAGVSTEIDSSSNAVNATLGDGAYIGQLKTIVMSDASNSSTVSVTNHETSDPEVFTFDAVDEYLLLVWTGTEWATVSGTATT